jgi:hypothetical protein
MAALRSRRGRRGRPHGSTTIDRAIMKQLIPLYVANPSMGLRAFYALVCKIYRANKLKPPSRSLLCEEIRRARRLKAKRK